MCNAKTNEDGKFLILGVFSGTVEVVQEIIRLDYGYEDSSSDGNDHNFSEHSALPISPEL